MLCVSSITEPNQAASLERRDCTAIPFGRPWRGVGEPQRSLAKVR
jgi:hypothetical protein